PRLEVLCVAVVDQSVEAVDRFDHDVAAAATIAAARPAVLDELLAPERDAAGAAVAGANIDLGFVEEFHGLYVGERERKSTACLAALRRPDCDNLRVARQPAWCRRARSAAADRPPTTDTRSWRPCCCRAARRAWASSPAARRPC